MKNGYQEFFQKARAAKENPVRKSLKKDLDLSALRQLSKKKRIKRKLPVLQMFLGVVVICLAALAFNDSDKLVAGLEKLEFSFIGKVQAEEKASSTAPAAAETTKKDGKTAEPDSKDQKLAADQKKDEARPDEVDHILKLSERKKELDFREEELNRLDTELARQRTEIEAKIKSLDDTRTNISSVLHERAVKDQEKVDSLTLMYSNMKPSQAARVIESMDEDLAVEILGRMKKKNAAEIMNLMKSEKAQMFSEKYAGYRKR